MAEVLNELATADARVETGSSTRINKRKRAAVVKKPRKNGTERLRFEADRWVARNWKGIVGALSEKVLKGDLPAVKTLVGFAEGKKAPAEPQKKKRTGPTAAQELMEDLWLHGEWKGDREEGLGEVGHGGLEMENGE